MKVGILTGGGDVPGLNPCIKTIVNRLTAAGHEVIGFRRGWAGPLEVNPEDPDSVAKHTVKLTTPVVRTVDRTGGTFLHSSRTNPGKVKVSGQPVYHAETEAKTNADGTLDLTAQVICNLDALGVETLVPIGGDDTLGYGGRLHAEGVQVVACPKTMDNDVYGTDYCMGFSTAVTRSAEAITNLRTSAGSHERVAVIELFGRNSGETALISSYVTDSERALLCEVPFDPDRLASLVQSDLDSNVSNYAMVIVSEGATALGGEIIETGKADAYGHRKLGGIGEATSEMLKARLGVDIINQKLAYLMRTGAPDTLDLLVARTYGHLAADLLLAGQSGRMVALREGKFTHIDMSEVTQGVRRVDVDRLYDVDAYRPKLNGVEGLPMFLY